MVKVAVFKNRESEEIVNCLELTPKPETDP